MCSKPSLVQSWWSENILNTYKTTQTSYTSTLIFKKRFQCRHVLTSRSSSGLRLLTGKNVGVETILKIKVEVWKICVLFYKCWVLRMNVFYSWVTSKSKRCSFECDAYCTSYNSGCLYARWRHSLACTTSMVYLYTVASVQVLDNL